VAVVDCARMFDEFQGGKDLLADNIDEDDIESLLIQQLEFCTTVVLNKTDQVTPEQIAELKAIVRSLQKDAKIVEATTATSRHGRAAEHQPLRLRARLQLCRLDRRDGAPRGARGPRGARVRHRDLCVRAPPALRHREAFGLRETWPDAVIRTKGMLWAAQDPDMCYIFEQAGQQVTLSENGLFVVGPRGGAQADHRREPRGHGQLGPEVGDRMTKLCFIGRNLDRDELVRGLDKCLTDWVPLDDEEA
jgi:G3E family GTPase